MIEPVAAQTIALTALCAGAVVMFGAAYAICLALGNLDNKRHLRIAANGAYGLLVVSMALLAFLLQLSQWWLALLAIVLVGYFVAPRMIWRLCVDIHSQEDQEVLHE